MDEGVEKMLQLLSPPLPSFISGGQDTYEAGQSHPNRRKIGVFDLLVVTKGSLQINEDDIDFDVDAKEILILYPNSYHFSPVPCNSTTHFYWFHFTTENNWINLSSTLTNQEYKAGFRGMNRDVFKEQSFSIRLPKHCKIVNWDKFEYLCSQITNNKSDSDVGVETSLEFQRQLLFQQFLHELSNNSYIEESLPSVALAEKTADYLRRNFAVKISYKDLGRALKFHPNHIARCMIGVIGYGPTEYLIRYRIERAKSLLIYTDWTMERIAENCGFVQQSYFSRSFKQREGITPYNFRESHKDKMT